VFYQEKHKKQLAILNLEIEKVRETNSELSAKVERLKVQHTKEVERLQEEKRSITNSITELHASLLDKEKIIKQLTEEKKGFNKEETNLKKEIRSLQTELNQSNSDKTKVITGLQEDLKKQLDENNRIKESLKNQLDALKKEYKEKEEKLLSDSAARLELRLSQATSEHEKREQQLLKKTELQYQNILKAKDSEYNAVLSERDKVLRELDVLSKENSELKNKLEFLNQQINSYEHEVKKLEDGRAELQLEIEFLDGLLSEEEKRLALTSTNATPITFFYNGTKIESGRKRRRSSIKHEFSQGAPFAKRNNIVHLKAEIVDKSGDVSIEEIDVDGNFVRLKNTTSHDINMTSWFLRAYCDTSGIFCEFVFPENYVINGKSTITIYTLLHRGAVDEERDLLWETEDPIWVNEAGFIELFDSHKESVSAGKVEEVYDGNKSRCAQQ
jgi:myosin heavy subunit